MEDVAHQIQRPVRLDSVSHGLQQLLGRPEVADDATGGRDHQARVDPILPRLVAPCVQARLVFVRWRLHQAEAAAGSLPLKSGHGGIGRTVVVR